MDYLLGLDIGTSGAKGLLMSTEGDVLTTEVVDYDIESPKVNWSEQDPQKWWGALEEIFFRLKSSYRLELKSVEAIGLSGQMHGALFVNKNGKPLYPCIIWADNRTHKECKLIKDILGDEVIYNITKNPIVPAYTASKILWFKRNHPELYRDTFKILMPKDYIGYKLTGRFYTDFSDASGTLLFDMKKKCWSKEILKALDLDINKQPEILPSTEIIGCISKNIANDFDLKDGIPVIAGCGDLACAAIGNSNFAEGKASVTIGTAGQVVATMNRIHEGTIGKTFNFCHAVNNKYFTLASVLSAGLSLKWFKNNISLIENILTKNSTLNSYDILLEGIESVTPGADGLIFLPYMNGAGTPYMNNDARGVFVGLTAKHTKKDMVRSIIEGVTFGIRECLETISEVGLDFNEIIISAGGAKNEKWQQIQADIYNTKVSTLHITDTSPFGAAILASIAYGKFNNIEEASNFYVRKKDELIPNPNHSKQYDLIYSNYTKIYPALQDYFNNSIKL